MLNLSVCNRDNLCVDCDSEKCILAGEIMSDCPKYHCDNDMIHDCEHCEFIRELQEEMREKNE